MKRSTFQANITKNLESINTKLDLILNDTSKLKASDATLDEIKDIVRQSVIKFYPVAKKMSGKDFFTNKDIKKFVPLDKLKLAIVTVDPSKFGWTSKVVHECIKSTKMFVEVKRNTPLAKALNPKGRCSLWFKK